SDFQPPFFAGAKLPSMNASLTSRRPSTRKSAASARICPSEFPTAPIAEIFCGRFGTEGSGQGDRPPVRPSAAPRVFRREQDGEIAKGDRGRLSDERALESVDLVQPTANR